MFKKKYVMKDNYNVDDLSSEDVDKIIEEVIMDFAS